MFQKITKRIWSKIINIASHSQEYVLKKKNEKEQFKIKPDL